MTIKPTILVTGATGNVGTHVLQRLIALKAPVRALSRDPARAAARFEPSIQWIKSDFSDSGLREALADVVTVVLITHAGPDLVRREMALVDAAKASGAVRIVKLSGLGAGPDVPIRLPKSHFESEKHVRASGLRGTFVRPNLFFQTLLGAADSILSEGAIYAPAGDGRISFTDARDVADVIAAAATSDQHSDRIYEITGPQALSYTEVAVAFSERFGRSVRHVDISPKSQREFLRASGMDEWTREAFVELFEIYRSGYGGNIYSEAVERITGRPARNLSDFLEDYRSNFIGASVSA